MGMTFIRPRMSGWKFNPHSPFIQEALFTVRTQEIRRLKAIHTDTGLETKVQKSKITLKQVLRSLSLPYQKKPKLAPNQAQTSLLKCLVGHQLNGSYTVKWPESEQNSLTFPDHSPVIKNHSPIFPDSYKTGQIPWLSRKIHFSLTFPDFPWWWEPCNIICEDKRLQFYSQFKVTKILRPVLSWHGSNPF